MNAISKFDRESLEFCKFLIKEKNADLNITDFGGNSPIHSLAKYVV